MRPLEVLRSAARCLCTFIWKIRPAGSVARASRTQAANARSPGTNVHQARDAVASGETLRPYARIPGPLRPAMCSSASEFCSTRLHPTSWSRMSSASMHRVSFGHSVGRRRPRRSAARRRSLSLEPLLPTEPSISTWRSEHEPAATPRSGLAHRKAGNRLNSMRQCLTGRTGVATCGIAMRTPRRRGAGLPLSERCPISHFRA